MTVAAPLLHGGSALPAVLGVPSSAAGALCFWTRDAFETLFPGNRGALARGASGLLMHLQQLQKQLYCSKRRE
jgi:hypothetical protein